MVDCLKSYPHWPPVSGLTCTMPNGALAPGRVLPKFSVPTNGLTRSAVLLPAPGAEDGAENPGPGGTEAGVTARVAASKTALITPDIVVIESDASQCARTRFAPGDTESARRNPQGRSGEPDLRYVQS